MLRKEEVAGTWEEAAGTWEEAAGTWEEAAEAACGKKPSPPPLHLALRPNCQTRGEHHLWLFCTPRGPGWKKREHSPPSRSSNPLEARVGERKLGLLQEHYDQN